MVALQMFLRTKDDENVEKKNVVVYGPSTMNKIERWWREIHERFEQFFKNVCRELKNSGDYDSSNLVHRYVDLCLPVSIV